MRSTLALLVLLTSVWAVLSGHYSTEALIFALGLLSMAAVTWLARRMDRLSGDRGLPPEALGQLLRLPRYLAFLALEIVGSNLHIARLALSLRPRVRQQLLRVPASQRSLLAQVVHANSITLTPGTVTLDLRGGELLVHAIDEASAASVVDGVIDRAASRLEGRVSVDRSGR